MDADIVGLNKRIRDELFALCRSGAMRPLLAALKENFPLLKRRRIGLTIKFVAQYFPIDEEDDVKKQAFPVGGITTPYSLGRDAESEILNKLGQGLDKDAEEELLKAKERGMKDVDLGLAFLEPPASNPKMCSACNGTGFSQNKEQH